MRQTGRRAELWFYNWSEKGKKIRTIALLRNKERETLAIKVVNKWFNEILRLADKNGEIGIIWRKLYYCIIEIVKLQIVELEG